MVRVSQQRCPTCGEGAEGGLTTSAQRQRPEAFGVALAVGQLHIDAVGRGRPCPTVADGDAVDPGAKMPSPARRRGPGVPPRAACRAGWRRSPAWQACIARSNRLLDPGKGRSGQTAVDQEVLPGHVAVGVACEPGYDFRDLFGLTKPAEGNGFGVFGYLVL